MSVDAVSAASLAGRGFLCITRTRPPTCCRTDVPVPSICTPLLAAGGSVRLATVRRRPYDIDALAHDDDLRRALHYNNDLHDGGAELPGRWSLENTGARPGEECSR